jgi:hypothetical protein
MRIEKYGAGGEKLSHAQLELFELAPVVSEMIEQSESEHAHAQVCSFDPSFWTCSSNAVGTFGDGLHWLSPVSRLRALVGRMNGFATASHDTPGRVACYLKSGESCKAANINGSCLQTLMGKPTANYPS